jgi:hypothetical protein
MCSSEITWIGKFKVRKVGSKIHYFEYIKMNYAELLKRMEDDGFRLPTEDEFEYLVGGGKRTLYRWGEIMLSDVAHRFDIPTEETPIDPPEGSERDPNYLADANFFGVSICFDPYKAEIVMDSPVRSKGGDGGCAMCGGCGLREAFMPYATYYRDICEEMHMDREITGDYSVSRRILRL